MKLDVNTMRFSDDDLRDILVMYAKAGKINKVIEIYKRLYPNLDKNEALRVAFFIRLSSGLDVSPDYY